MQAIKKIEIVADSVELPTVLKVLEDLGVTGYTVIRDVLGRGERGIRHGEGLTDVFKNSYVMTACDADQVPAIVEGIRPLLKRYGGVCLVTDGMWVIH